MAFDKNKVFSSEDFLTADDMNNIMEGINSKQDILANGDMDLSNYVQFTDLPSETKAGVIKVGGPSYGVSIVDGNPRIYSAMDGDATNRTNDRRPVVPNMFDKFLVAALTDGKIALDSDQKAAACTLLGALKTTNDTETAGRDRLYAIDGKTGEQKLITIAEFGTPISGFLVSYGSGGMITCGTPTAAAYAANKEYVDNLVQTSITGALEADY